MNSNRFDLNLPKLKPSLFFRIYEALHTIVCFVLYDNVWPHFVKNWCLLRQICLHRYWLPKTPLRRLKVTGYELCTHTSHLHVYTLSYSFVYILSYNFVCTVLHICMGAQNINAYLCMWIQFCFHVYTEHILCASVRADTVIKFCVHMDILSYNFVCMDKVTYIYSL